MPDPATSPVKCLICERPLLSCKHGPKRNATARGGRTMVSVDPGDKHVGVAVFEEFRAERTDATAWHCVYACEMNPEEFSDWLANTMVVGRIDVLIYERFILEPSQAPKLAGTELETPQLIGVIRWLHRQTKDENRWPGGPVELVGQTNKIKKPTRALLNHRKIKSVGKHLGVTADHVVDAELHGYHWLVKTKAYAVMPPDWDALRPLDK